MKYEKTENPRKEDVDVVLENLRAYNRSQAPEQPQQRMAVFARNAKDQVIGGATGEVNWGWLYIEMLWVHEDYRDQDVGTRLLSDIEDMARKYDVVGFHLGTVDFQALDFYLKNGYEVWGQLADFPPGHTNYSLKKLARRPN